MIYYVEDDTNIRDLTIYALEQAGFKARGFADAQSFFEACSETLPTLILLDIMLPETDGLEILQQLRTNKNTRSLPIMMLTAKGTEYDTVKGLDGGADDYLAKPFGMMELISRVNALMRRTNTVQANSDELSWGDLTLSVSAHHVRIQGQEVTLTLKEFDLLRVLLENKGQVLSRNQLLEMVWGISYAGGTRTVDVHIQTLRQKLNAASPGSNLRISTVRGVGYCIKKFSHE